MKFLVALGHFHMVKFIPFLPPAPHPQKVCRSSFSAPALSLVSAVLLAAGKWGGAYLGARSAVRVSPVQLALLRQGCSKILLYGSKRGSVSIFLLGVQCRATPRKQCTLGGRPASFIKNAQAPGRPTDPA